MKCDRCKVNDATNHIVMSYMGNAGEMRLCDGCLEDMRRYASGMIKSFDAAPAFTGFSEWAEGYLGDGLAPAGQRTRVMVKEPEAPPAPADLGEEIKRRRRLSELRARLKSAVEAEDYERAAGLRDRIFREEKECG
ncbi:MAG: UvrB/UvrC motif-containing protein [Oscillospiraceae bacterium]|jgi:protein-arginine kinase activator protein McsA|nr:UvrB/UvrC motif-containing protein [Oscillospiraceae bacterium]